MPAVQSGPECQDQPDTCKRSSTLDKLSWARYSVSERQGRKVVDYQARKDLEQLPKGLSDLTSERYRAKSPFYVAVASSRQHAFRHEGLMRHICIVSVFCKDCLPQVPYCGPASTSKQAWRRGAEPEA